MVCSSRTEKKCPTAGHAPFNRKHLFAMSTGIWVHASKCGVPAAAISLRGPCKQLYILVERRYLTAFRIVPNSINFIALQVRLAIAVPPEHTVVLLGSSFPCQPCPASGLYAPRVPLSPLGKLADDVILELQGDTALGVPTKETARRIVWRWSEPATQLGIFDAGWRGFWLEAVQQFWSGALQVKHPPQTMIMYPYLHVP